MRKSTKKYGAQRQTYYQKRKIHQKIFLCFGSEEKTIVVSQIITQKNAQNCTNFILTPNVGRP